MSTKKRALKRANKGVQEVDARINNELDSLINRRCSIIEQLERFQSFFVNFDQSKKGQLPDRIKKCEGLWDSFDEVQTKIESLSEDIEGDERQVFEEQYFEIVSLAKSLLHDNASNNFGTNPLIKSNTSEQNLTFPNHAKLPSIEIPKFNGSYDQWVPFYDLFNSLIHSNNTLTNIQKFYYLKSYLIGDAADVIHSLQISEQNYEVAWNLLKDRFENKRLIINNYLKVLFDIQPLTKESPTQLRRFLDETKKALRVLEVLQQPVQAWNTILIYMLSNKLDPGSRREWEASTMSRTEAFPVLDEFFEFLAKRCQLFETLDQSKNKSENKSNYSSGNKPTIRTVKQSFAATNNSSISCPVCKEGHLIFMCNKFLDLPVESRITEVKRLKLCLNCLRNNHLVANCYSRACRKCGRKHNSLLHIDNSSQNNAAKGSETQNSNQTQCCAISQNQENSSVSQNIVEVDTKNQIQTFSGQQVIANKCVQPDIKQSEILLATARIYILDRHGNAIECRAMLDSGSQSNFMTQELCERLQLSKTKINIPVVGIGQAVTNISTMTNTTILSRLNSFKTNVSFLVVDCITDTIPSVRINSEALSIPQDILLADPMYYIPGKIDLLIGATLFWELLSVGQVKLSRKQPTLQKTKFGWVVVGAVPYQGINNSTRCNLSVNDVHQQLERFWNTDEPVQEKPLLTKQEELCESYFQETTVRDENGRFCVRLPLKDEKFELGNSFNIALNRFESLEKKLNNNPNFKNLYINFMEEYRQLGHMSLIKENNQDQGQEEYYLPHHGILKECSQTTKLRVVFDASAKTEKGVSLNDNLMIGPKIQDDLFDILLRFRKYLYVIAADVEKMYRQINIAEDQRSLQRILWRSNPEEQVQVYQLNTVTYGTASAPFLAVRCLHQIGLDIKSTQPEVSRVLIKDFYMDDVLSGANTIEDAKTLKKELSKTLEEYGFHLRKWLANHSDILNDLDHNDSSYLILEDKTVKTLGLIWNSERDLLQYSVKDMMECQKITKRTILSAISQIFDPLGLVGPTIVKAKIILQRLWQLNLNWDESLPMDIHTSWIQIAQHLSSLNNIQIPRAIFDPTESVRLELHCFCDASEQAYGCCLYARSINSDKHITVQLICAKSRVAPIKQISLPRLELCGALLASQLTTRVVKALEMCFDSIVYWTDSTIVLSWLAGEPTNWKTFVANRVAEIQRLTSNHTWRHVRSEYNPADVISRGLNPEQLENCHIWWHGPYWLQEDTDWLLPDKTTKLEIPDKRQPPMQTHNVITRFSLFNELCAKFSSFVKLQRIVAFCLRFINNARIKREEGKFDALSVDELNLALEFLVKGCQEAEFSEEINTLKRNKCINKSSKLLPLDPILDSKKVLRVGGRLNQSNLDFDQKHPIILPKDHVLTKLIILYYHYQFLHAGPQALLANIRLKFWPLSGRNTIRKILSRCIVCFRNKPKDVIQVMGELPPERIEPRRPFSVCGTDFAGPFKIKTSRLRGHKIIKVYMCIFVCFVTKAVHIEVVSDLTTDAFLNCFKRFIARRGLCAKIYSDNGSNFVGAFNELQGFYDFLNRYSTKNVLQDHFSKLGISWSFIPPRSPHFGGLWEGAVKSAKYHIKRVIGESILTFEELCTVFAQVEACLNSRPLVPLSENPNDLQVLSPAHFLIGAPLAALPQPDLTFENGNLLTRYQLVTQINQQFWRRWSREYLNTLQPRSKWKTSAPSVQPGTIVLLKEDNVPPNQWCLGRVVEVYRGKDGKVRVINVKTSKGVFKRSITKICVLPIDTD